MRTGFARALILTTAVSFAATPAVADIYVGGNATLFEYRQAGFSDELSLPAAMVKLGGQFSDYLSAEVRAGFGLDDDDARYLGYNNDVKVDSMYGVYLKAGVPVAGVFYPYALIGWTDLDMVSTVYGYGRTDGGSDTSYGFGVDLYVGAETALSLEYVNYYDKASTDVSGLSIGAHTRF